jgi:hypothetical protein
MHIKSKSGNLKGRSRHSLDGKGKTRKFVPVLPFN